MATVTRYIGKCPVCERDQKLRVAQETRTGRPLRASMVHHGYKRPGHGEIEGDCFGVDYPPYEISTVGTERYLEVITKGIDQNKQHLRHLQNDNPTLLVEKNPYRGRHVRPEFEELTTADGYKYQDALKSRINATLRATRALEMERTRCERLIRDWTPQPVRTEEELEQVRVRMTETRRAALDEARAAKQAKREALDAKQRAREQEQLDLLAEYRQLFNELAFREDETAARKEAQAHWVKMQKRKRKKEYLNFYESWLEIPEALVKLDLAVLKEPGANPADARSYVYANDLGWKPTPWRS
jgi:hypothetical protein